MVASADEVEVEFDADADGDGDEASAELDVVSAVRAEQESDFSVVKIGSWVDVGQSSDDAAGTADSGGIGADAGVRGLADGDLTLVDSGGTEEIASNGGIVSWLSDSDEGVSALVIICAAPSIASSLSIDEPEPVIAAPSPVTA